VPFDKVTSLSLYKKLKSGRTSYFNELFERAYVLKKSIDSSDELILISDGDLVRFFESKIAQVLFHASEINSEDFLCGTYIAKLLSSVVDKLPHSLYVVDYIVEGVETGNFLSIRNGADLCFLFCSLFKERASHRSMNLRDYEIMGAGLYYQYYSATSREVGYYMSKKFNVMAEVTRESVASLNVNSH